MRVLSICAMSAAISLSFAVAAQAATGTLQNDVNQFQSAGVTSAVAETVSNKQVVQAVAGTAQLGTASPVSVNTRYRTGSVTKTFVSTVILQLVGEGKMSLDDTVDHWLPGLITGNGNDGTKITIRELLQHTSGLFDYTHDSRFLATVDNPADFVANNLHQYSPSDLIGWALSHPPNFAPGTSWSYSNTNYIIAGLVIKAVTDNTWDVEVTNRIVKPLGLNSTSIPGTSPNMPAPFAHAYNIWSASGSHPNYTDTTVDNMSWGDSAGAIITDTTDELTFFTALLTGKLLKPAQLTAMQTTVPISSKSGYGLGIIHTTMCNLPNGLWWHNGGTIGYDTFVGVTPDGATGLAYDVSTSDLLGDDTAFDSAEQGASDSIARHAFCGTNTTSTDSLSAEENAVNGKNPPKTP